MKSLVPVGLNGSYKFGVKTSIGSKPDKTGTTEAIAQGPS